MSDVAYAAIAKNARGRLQSATGYEKANQALIHLTDIWCLPGIVLQITDTGEVIPVYRVAGNGVIYGFEPYPVNDTAGAAYCPRCHAAPRIQHPHYADPEVFRCEECGNVYRPAKLTS